MSLVVSYRLSTKMIESEMPALFSIVNIILPNLSAAVIAHRIYNTILCALCIPHTAYRMPHTHLKLYFIGRLWLVLNIKQIEFNHGNREIQ